MPDIAIFDLDYTLTRRGTWGRFVMKAVRFKPWYWLPLWSSAGLMQLRYLMGGVPRIQVKQTMMRWGMVGSCRLKMRRLAQEFADREIAKGLRPGAVAALQKHKEAGDTIIIASAAVDLVVEPIARNLDVKYWVATEMAWENGVLAPHFASKNCYGPEKLARVKRLLEQNPQLKQNHTHITMYSDSHSDIEILRFCDKGVAVHGDEKLIAMAKIEGFEILDW